MSVPRNPDIVRKLAYIDKFMEELDQITTALDNDDNRLVLSYNSDNLIHYTWTGLEFTKLYSALLLGAELVYPDESMNITQLLLRGVDMPIDLCALVADCINTDSAVQSALQGQLGGGGYNNSGGGAGGGADAVVRLTNNPDNLLRVSNCSDDSIYAIVKGIVDTAIQNVEDAYQTIESATNGLELVSRLGDNMPPIASIPAVAAEMADWINETASDAFVAYDTITVRNELTCELWCLAKENGCSLTFDDLFLFFAGKTAVAVLNVTLTEIVQNAVDLTDQQAIFYASIAAQFATLAIGGRFGGLLGAQSFDNAVRYYKNDSNPDWSFCDPCVVPCVTDFYDFTVQSYSSDWFVRANAQGNVQYVAGQGYRSLGVAGNAFGAQIYATKYQGLEVQHISFTVSGANKQQDIFNFVPPQTVNTKLSVNPFNGSVIIDNSILLVTSNANGGSNPTITSATVTYCP